jgi:hypothetical protein
MAHSTVSRRGGVGRSDLEQLGWTDVRKEFIAAGTAKLLNLCTPTGHAPHGYNVFVLSHLATLAWTRSTRSVTNVLFIDH